jgi:hypothetical protein
MSYNLLSHDALDVDEKRPLPARIFSRIESSIIRNWRLIALCYVVIFTAMAITLALGSSHDSQNGHDDLVPRRGDMSESICWKDYRTAEMTALFTGFIAIDQWLAHNWALAALKVFVTGWAIWMWWNVDRHWFAFFVMILWWWVDAGLWVWTGVYTVPSCCGSGFLRGLGEMRRHC